MFEVEGGDCCDNPSLVMVSQLNSKNIQQSNISLLHNLTAM